MESKDLYTRGHGERVGALAALVARQSGMRPGRVEGVRLSAMMHDIGKLSVPATVLHKSGRLTEQEYAAMMEHPIRGRAIVQGVADLLQRKPGAGTRKLLDEALSGILHHHEKYDGTGYPIKLAGRQIPEFARVIAVADVFDTLTSTRSHRKAWSAEQALAELQRTAGSHFDPRMVEALVQVIEREGWQPHEPPPSNAEVETTWQFHDDPTLELRIIGGRTT